VFHVTSGESICNLDLVKLLADGVEKYFPSLPNGTLRQKIRHVSDRPGHDARYAISSEKLRSELGWQPTVKLSEGLKKTIDWYFEHPEFFTYQRSMGYHGDRLGCSIDKSGSEK
jgi:dTDP-glucose 4,6-dehydratase